MVESSINDRDKFIYIAVKHGYSFDKIGKKIHLGETRVRQIYLEQRDKILYGDPDIPEIDEMCRTLGIREQERGKLQSILHKNGYDNNSDKWRSLTKEQIRAIHKMGPMRTSIVWLAQNMKREGC